MFWPSAVEITEKLRSGQSQGAEPVSKFYWRKSWMSKALTVLSPSAAWLRRLSLSLFIFSKAGCVGFLLPRNDNVEGG